GIPFIVPDGLSGTAETVVKINGQINKEVFIAYDITRSQSILSVAHVTGHVAAGLGATLKTLGMGCASKKGKMKQHAALKLKTRPFLTDTNVLYASTRHDAIGHYKVAARHGFGLETLGIPFIVAGGLVGTAETAIEVNCEINKEVYIASDIVWCRSILAVAHFTGHLSTCAAAVIKTLGMGCASRRGKMKQHVALKLVIGDNCKRCGECVKHCPADAITLDDIKAHIDQDKCIGCAECLAVCRFGAVEYDWKSEDEVLQKSIAEHALGVLKGKQDKAAFFSFLMSITKDCDCFDTPDMPKIVDDIGILASTDPVAIDKAALDLIEAKGGKKLTQLTGYTKLNPLYHIEHAEHIGLGSTDYELIELD
ncbi:MAG: DUF362 domain-containing protein, partial [Sedimentisphaerales bacterium]|nr:DUF362 domain-containing protein [Sedimentisphaerales bacterium]